MAYVPPKGFVAGYAGAKLPTRKPSKPTTPTVGAANPYQAPTLGGFTVAELAKMSPSQIALISANLAAQGPDYSKVDFEKLRGIAASAAQSNYDQSSQPVWIERGWNKSRQKLSSDAATNFAAAMASILQGGKTGQEGMDYALQNYGGSYLGAIAGRMGQELISRQQDYFTGEDAQLAGELNKLWDQMPGEREKMYEELVKQGMDGVLTNHKNAIVALAALQDSKRKDAGGGTGEPVVRDFSDGTSRQYNPQTGKWDVVTSEAAAPSKPRIFQTSEGVFAINEATGQVVWEKKNGKKKTTKVTTQVVEQPDGSKNLIDKSTGKVLKVVAPPDPNAGDGSGTTSNGKPVSPSSMSTTVARAQKAAEDVLGAWTDAIRQKYALPQDASDAAKAANTKKYQAEVARNFGRAMYKVITAIAPHLKALGYTHARIKWEAYQMVRAAGITPLPSYKAPKPPKADAARVAASNPLPPPQAIDFNWLAAATTGSTNRADLGGPTAHYAKHDSGENWQSNNAWDIGMPVGTPIYAATDGVVGSDVGVQASRPDDGQRLTLNGQGNSFWYGHLSKVAVRPGQRVRAGQLIGYSGASANGAAHLHIGVMNIGGNHA